MNLSRIVVAAVAAVELCTGCKAAPPSLAQTNTIVRLSGTGVVAYADIYAALRTCQSGDTVLVGPGTYRVHSPGPEWLMTGKSDVRIKGVGMPVIEVEEGASYQMGIQIPHNNNLVIEGIVLRIIAPADNNKLLYGMVVTGCRNVLVSNCVFHCEMTGTNSVFKHFVAVNAASNVVVVDSAVLIFDTTGKNDTYCVAAHDADPPLFSNVLFSARSPQELSVGVVRAVGCRAAQAFSVRGYALAQAAPGEIGARSVLPTGVPGK